jgi:hypothetical protein
MHKFIAGLILMSLCGCAAGAGLITQGVTALGIVDSFYNKVVDKKSVPNTLQAATIILQQADALAQMAKAGKDTPAMIAQATLLAAQADKLAR